jgi:hypothetical protein
LLGVAPPEPGIDGGASADFAANEGLNEMNVEQLMSRAAARDSAAADGLAVDVIGRLICADYGWDISFPCDQTPCQLRQQQLLLLLLLLPRDSPQCSLLQQQMKINPQWDLRVENCTRLDVASDSPGCLIG